MYGPDEYREEFSDLHFNLEAAMSKAREQAPPSIQRGMDALTTMSEGYSSADIAAELNSAPNQVRAIASKARKYLKARPEFLHLQYGCITR